MTLTIPQKESENKQKHHSVLVYHKEFTEKPDAKKDVGKIHNTFKRDPNLKGLSYTLNDIVKEFCNGKTLMLANVQRELRNQKDIYEASELDPSSSEWANLHTLNFKSTTILGIDIDDEYSQTDVHQVIDHFNGKVSAAYYSFSHGRVNDRGGTENRYRLLFQLDEPLTDFDAAKEFAIVLRDELLELYPDFSTKNIDTMFPTSLWHGSGLPPIYVKEDAFLNTNEYMVKVGAVLAARREAYEKRRKRQKEAFESATHNPVLFDELFKMANAIGHLPSGGGQEGYNKWLFTCLSIRSHEYADQITEEEGIQLFNIISGYESDESFYLNLRPNGERNIGSFIKLAEEAGYKRKHKYSYALQEAIETIPVERVTVDRYITPNLVAEWLGRRERLIVDSPTGSGKTTAVMKCFKQLESRAHKYFIFAVPTIALSEQVAEKHNVVCAKGGIKDFENFITGKAASGERVFVSTYDKAAEVISHIKGGLSSADEQPEFYIVIDEVHKYTDAYNYRFVTIDNLRKLSILATSLIGLSGTTEDILKNDFDKLIKVNNGVKGSPNLDYRVFTYDTNESGIITPENADLMLVPVVRGLLQQTRVLLFINNKDRIQRIARLLRREGITVQTISSDDRNSITYASIIENEAIDDNVQVVICTTVLADGVTIENKLDWSCLVVSDDKSPLFNPSTIKQISNRFRNQYRYFALYMRSPNPEYEETRRFNIESEYQYRLKVVKNHVDYLNEEYDAELISGFIPSAVEKYNGIFYKSTEEDARIEFNELFTRHQSMKSKEFYYRGHRDAFIKEVGRIIGHKLTGIFNVNDEIRKNGSDLSGLLAEIRVEAEEIKLEADELRANFTRYFTEEIYEAIVYQNDESSLDSFKDSIHADQWSATLKNAALTDFETCKTLGEAVKRRADINKYSNDIKALAEIATFDYVKKVSVTKRIYRELAKMELKMYVSSDFKGIVEDKLPKTLKVRKSEVKEALKLFHKFSTRNENERLTTIRPLSVELVSKIRHKIDPEVVERSLLKYTDTRSPQQRKIMQAAVLEKWNINSLKDTFFTQK